MIQKLDRTIFLKFFSEQTTLTVIARKYVEPK